MIAPFPTEVSGVRTINEVLTLMGVGIVLCPFKIIPGIVVLATSPTKHEMLFDILHRTFLPYS